MTDLFNLMAESSDLKTDANYGLSGEMKKTQYVLELIGSPVDPDSLKCIITAAEQGMEMNCYSIINSNFEDIAARINNHSPLSIKPCLKEADFYTNGSDAITAFIDARGLGYTLTPRNAELAAVQCYWVDIAVNNVAPYINNIVEEVFYNKYKDPSYKTNTEKTQEASEHLNIFLDALDKQLEGKKFIVCDKYTWADLHWTVYLHLYEVAGYGEEIQKRSRVKKWFDRIKSKKSQCGQDEVAYDTLPNEKDIRDGKLRQVTITNY